MRSRSMMFQYRLRAVSLRAELSSMRCPCLPSTSCFRRPVPSWHFLCSGGAVVYVIQIASGACSCMSGNISSWAQHLLARLQCCRALGLGQGGFCSSCHSINQSAHFVLVVLPACKQCDQSMNWPVQRFVLCVAAWKRGSRCCWQRLWLHG